MADVTRHWGRRTLDFVDAVEGAEFAQCCQTIPIRDQGLHACIMAGLPARGTALPDLTLANAWPAQWFELYTRENFSALDPVPRFGASTLQPFEWSEVRYEADDDPAAHLRRAGAHAGVCR